MLTIFIGGNHEASNYLQELPFGGWVAPNIYYLGYAGVVTYRGVRIGGMSGIYKSHDFYKGHYESPPYGQDTMRSVYHYRQQEVFRLKQLAEPVDMMMSHDWPREVYNHGDANQLIRFKPHFRDEILDDKLGSPPCLDLLKKLKPDYWFSGHLHCKFSAVIPHDGSEKKTKFLALDKCLPKRRFLQIIDVEAKNDNARLQYDLEWLTILYTTRHLTHIKPTSNYMPGEGSTSGERWDFRPNEEEKNFVLNRLENNLEIPENFERTAAPFVANNPQHGRQEQPQPTTNPQTVRFTDLLGIDDPLNLVLMTSGRQMSKFCDPGPDPYEQNAIAVDVESALNSTASSPGMSSPLQKRLSLLDTLPTPKLFVIDTLNPEETLLEMSDDECNTLAEPKDVNLLVSNEDVTNAGDDGEGAQVPETPSAKKTFKRRNAAIYNAADDD